MNNQLPVSCRHGFCNPLQCPECKDIPVYPKQEIKAGQRWKLKKPDQYSYILTVVFADGESVLTENECGKRCLDHVHILTEYYELIPEPKTRPITAADIIKMLAVNPTIYRCHRIGQEWGMLTAPAAWLVDNEKELAEYQYSHNPFATNPVIVGPMVVDEVGK
jgi:hypothetical protein